LLAMAATEPNGQVRVIIQKSDADADVAETVAEMDGTVIKELSIINALVAEMPAERAVDIALDASVNWVRLDDLLEQSQTSETSTVRDEFGAYAYDNNDGTVPWATDWQESGESDGPRYGYLRIYSSQLLIRGGHRTLARSVNLSGAETAVLTFDYRLYSFDSSSDYVTVEISSDGGSSWRELDRLAGPASQSNMQPASYDISADAAENSVIRFATSPYLGRLDYFFVDNIQIEYGSAGTTVAAPVNDMILTVGDDFEAVPPAYNNNSGTRSWITDWQEFGDNNQPDNGAIYISQNQMGQNLALAKNYGYVWRAANLEGATYATLSFDYASALYFQDTLLIEVSADGGLTWAELDRISIPYSTTLLAAQYDISDYIASNTAVRFTAINQYGYPLIWLDNIQIEFDGASSYLPPNYYPETLGLPQVWQMGITGRGVGVAVIDSGIANDEDFSQLPANSGSGTRLLVQENFNDATTTLTDTYGHGTHIAGIIAGNGSKSDGYYKGIAPEANLISLKIIGDDGLAYESDTVEAMQWVLDHKDEYNIRVVNLSINSSNVNSYHESPLDIAAEILWFNDIVVVASAGNRATVYDWFNPVLAPPANDPFIITVGASNELGSANPADDFIPFFSTSGITVDGYQKPEIIAPGKNIISVLASSSWWRNEHLDRVVDGNYFRISGTSMSAPMVAGAAALLLQAEPNLTPDQVKYRLMHTARTIDGIFSGDDFPYLDVYTAVTTSTTESANQDVIPSMPLAKMALIAYWASQNGGETIDWSNIDWNAVNWDAVDWDTVDWNSVNWGSVNWGSVNWGSVNWGSVNWGSVNWGSVNWGSVNWGSVNWGSVNWGSVNWGSVNWNG
ncbi:MAG: S8 family serine peptidase, partial [Anaerolineae bacterium]